MDTETRLIFLVAAIIALVSAVITYRTAKLKQRESEGGGLGGGNVNKHPGPFDAMFAVFGSFGVVLGPRS